MADVGYMVSGNVSRYGKKWQYRARDRYGRQKRKIGFDTKAEAREALENRLRELREGTPEQQESVTLAEWAKEWLRIVAETRKESTAGSYANIMRTHILPDLGHFLLSDITEKDLRELYRARVASNFRSKTIKNIHAVLTACLKEATRNGLLKANPASNVTPPKGRETKTRRVWSFEETERFLKTIKGQEDELFWALWVNSGLRKGEIRGLRWSEIDFERGVFRVNWQITTNPDTGRPILGTVKTAAGNRSVPIGRELLEMLQNRPVLGTYVFEGMTSYKIKTRLKELCETAGVQLLTPHEIRHTFGTRGAEAGIRPEVLSRIMGHSRIETTLNLYVHPKMDEAKAATDLLTARLYGVWSDSAQAD